MTPLLGSSGSERRRKSRVVVMTESITEAKALFQPPAPRGELLWDAVDFDGTLAHGTWSIDNPTAPPGPPIWLNVTKLHRLVDAGRKIIIHTARPSSDYELIEAWLKHYKIPFHQIITGKLLAARYIDDRAVPADAESWL